MSAERTAPCAATRRDDGHICGYTNCSDPAFSKPSCDVPNFAQIVADENGTTIEVGHGDDLLPAMTPEAAAELGAALADLAAAAGAPPAELGSGSGRLDAIRGLLAEFSGSFYEVGETRNLIERIEQIAGSSRTESGIEPGGSAHITAADLKTVLGALGEAADELRDRAANCPDCDRSPADLCGTCESRLGRAGDYGTLAARLGGAS